MSPHQKDEILVMLQRLNEREQEAIEFIATAILDQRQTVKTPGRLLLHFNGEGQIRKWEMTQVGEFK